MGSKKSFKKFYLLIAVILLIAGVFLLALNLGEHPEEFELEKNFCLPEQREAEVCTTEWEPVCGFREDNSSELYSNSCFACMDPEIIYWTEAIWC
jgi:hypothetical protein